MKKKLLVSFSGGETSAYMAWYLAKHKRNEYDMAFVFANTGQENEETLVFVEKCGKAFGFETTWVEAVVDPDRMIGVRHRVVDFSTASRNGEPFEAVIAAYGIPNMAYPHCSRDLKTGPMHSYVKYELGWSDYYTAVGIRNDEIDRINPSYKEKKIIYPLVMDVPMSKPKINFWWRQQPFRLDLKGYQGNCKWCWKKSLNKLLTIALENPEHFDFPKAMQEKYGGFIPDGRNGDNVELPIRFFRGRRSVEDIFEMSKLPFQRPVDDSDVYNWQTSILDVDLEVSNGCQESCEPFDVN